VWCGDETEKEVGLVLVFDSKPVFFDTFFFTHKSIIMFLTKTFILFIFCNKKMKTHLLLLLHIPISSSLCLSLLETLSTLPINLNKHYFLSLSLFVISITHIRIIPKQSPQIISSSPSFLASYNLSNFKSVYSSSKRLHQSKMMMRKPDITTIRDKGKPNHACGGNNNKPKLRKGLWSPDEDEKLIRYMLTNGQGCWSDIARNAGLLRCGKSCRLRWINYLRPDLKRGSFSPQEEDLIFHLHSILGNR